MQHHDRPRRSETELFQSSDHMNSWFNGMRGMLKPLTLAHQHQYSTSQVHDLPAPRRVSGGVVDGARVRNVGMRKGCGADDGRAETVSLLCG